VKQGSFAARRGFIVPDWRRLAVVCALSLLRAALSLTLPYLSKMLNDRALAWRDLGALYRTVGLFKVASIAGFVLIGDRSRAHARLGRRVLRHAAGAVP
jgi:hypothetical protein